MHSSSVSHRVVGLVWIVGASALTFAACGGSSGTGVGTGNSTGSSGSSFGAFGSSGSSGSSGVSGSSGGTSGSSSSSGGGVAATCIVGNQGCLCDSRGQCTPGLTCAPQKGGPPLCCSGSNCLGTGTGIGTVCPPGSGAAAACTPGSVTIPPATAGNDTCGYANASFNEYVIFCGMTATGGGNAPATINVFYNDEHAMPLGCANATYPVSTYPGTPTALYYPETGDPACTDTVQRPMRPVLYITDITSDPSCTAGDQQHGGKPYYPVAVFGSWKTASENGTIGQPAGGDPAANGWTLPPGADPVPASVKSVCAGGGGGGGRGGGGGGGGYGAEIQFAAGLIPGHSYRLQTILHDGDQTRGADSGEGCAIFCASAGVACQPACGKCSSNAGCCSGLTCNNGVCGPCAQADGGPPPI